MKLNNFEFFIFLVDKLILFLTGTITEQDFMIYWQSDF